MTMKTTARRNYPAEKRYSTWYEPFDGQRYITAARFGAERAPPR